MSRSISQILWYVESKAARNEGVRLNNVEAKALAEHITAVNERPALLARVRELEEAGNWLMEHFRPLDDCGDENCEECKPWRKLRAALNARG